MRGQQGPTWRMPNKGLVSPGVCGRFPHGSDASQKGSMRLILRSPFWPHHETVIGQAAIGGKGESRRRPFAKLRAALAFVWLFQFSTLCICASGASLAVDPHECCPEPASKPPMEQPAFSLTSGSPDCCQTMDSQTPVTLGPTDLAAPPLVGVTSTASLGTPTNQTLVCGSALTAVGRTTPPRSPILRI